MFMVDRTISRPSAMFDVALQRDNKEGKQVRGQGKGGTRDMSGSPFLSFWSSMYMYMYDRTY